jgi:hypothetical protein
MMGVSWMEIMIVLTVGLGALVAAGAVALVLIVNMKRDARS